MTFHDPLVRAFEEASIDPATFHHREHLYVAWCYLRALPLEEALARFVHHLRALTVALGAPGKFHATITWLYVVLLDQAMERSPGASFDELLAENPALLDHREGALLLHYDRGQLDSPEARRRFVLPTRS
ncbi:hypothetical protein [Pendulispora albinea]|uniref:Uncharacterized protein n=1 Tax=Pendulispora albinea TaxID=2741071 RepID=A0ABZ2LXL3_9BACT